MDETLPFDQIEVLSTNTKASLPAPLAPLAPLAPTLSSTVRVTELLNFNRLFRCKHARWAHRGSGFQVIQLSAKLANLDIVSIDGDGFASSPGPEKKKQTAAVGKPAVWLHAP